MAHKNCEYIFSLQLLSSAVSLYFWPMRFSPLDWVWCSDGAPLPTEMVLTSLLLGPCSSCISSAPAGISPTLRG